MWCVSLRLRPRKRDTEDPLHGNSRSLQQLFRKGSMGDGKMGGSVEGTQTRRDNVISGSRNAEMSWRWVLELVADS